MNRASLLIPVRGSDENVEVFIDELPEDADDILAILQAEIAPLDIWLKFAVEYYRQGKIESFLKILNEGTDPGLEEYYADSKTERIALLNALASYYTQLAARERDTTKKDDYFRQATGTFNKADKIDAFEFLTWVGKGVLFLCKGDLDRATYNFDTVLQNQPDNIPAIMGKACVQFNKSQYQEALSTYKSILVKNPTCPPAVRLGLGFCFYKLGRTDLARQAFERVLQLEPNNVEALVGLAIFELNTEKQGSITNAMQMLKKAFEANSTNSMVLNHLANHFFYKKDYQKVHTLALQAYHNTEVVQTKAFSCYLLAKQFHAQEDFENAYNYYAQALRHWPSFDLAQFGVAQMLLHKGQSDNAITYFESVLTAHPDNFETLKILGSLYAQSKNSKDKAKGYLKKATDLNSGDYEAWVELAQLTELSDPAGALAAYEKAKQLLQKRKEKVSPELWNNLAVLRHKLGKLKDAEEAYKGALIASGNVVPDNSNECTKEVKAQTVTMLYNLGRLYEDMHDAAKAEEIYLSILKEHPNYVDCYMRLGCIERDRKQYSAASTWFTDCLVISQENHDAWALIGNMHLGKEEWQQAQKKFEKIIEKDRNDPYSLLSLGNIYYNAKFNTAEKEAKYVRLANDFYWRVLQKNPANIYAANGVGIVFAEKGEIGLAKEFFTQVSEAAESMADVRLNLAHIHFAQGLFINAVKLYQNCLKKYYDNKDPDVLLCLARAYFEWNKMDECKQTIQKAIHLDPTNQVLWYNLALAQHRNATNLLQKHRRTLQDIQAATADLNNALAVFTTLSQPRTAAKPAYSVTKVQRFVKLCTQLQKDASTILSDAERAEAELAQRRAEQLQQKEETERLAREKRAQEEAEAEEKRAEQERIVQQLLEQQNRVLEKYVNPEPVPEEEEEGDKKKKKKKGKGKKKGKKGAEEEETQEGAQEETQEEPQEETQAGEEMEEAEGESWEDMRNKRNPMAKELARKQKERESAKKEKKRRRVVDDEEGEQEKRKKKNKGKKSAAESEEEEDNAEANEDEEQLPEAEQAEEDVEVEEGMEETQVDADQSQEEAQGETEETQGESEPQAEGETEEQAEASVDADDMQPTQVDADQPTQVDEQPEADMPATQVDPMPTD